MSSYFKINRSLSFVIALALILSVAGLKMTARSTVMGGVVLGGVDLGGLSYLQANSFLNDKENSLLNDVVQFEYGGVLQNISLADLGFEIDEEATLERLKDVSYGEGMFDNLGGRLISVFADVEVVPVLKIDSRKMVSKLQEFYPDLASPKNAEIVVEGTDVSILGHKDGVRIDVNQIENEILSSLENFEMPGRISISVAKAAPAYLTSKAQADAEVLRSVLGRKIVLRFTEFENMIDERTAVVTEDFVAVKDGEILFNSDFIKDLLRNDMQPIIDRPVQHAKIKAMPSDGSSHAIVEGTARTGLTLNLDESASVIGERLLAGENEIELVVDREIGLIVNDVTDDEFVLLSEGVSGYWGSPWGRRYNINKGLSEVLENVVVQPGATFSFNDNLGPVERAYGWQDSLAIFGGDELIPVPGGGLCQVSTTLYRAVLGAGLEVVEQSGHTLYVTYYEEFGNGLDAAIYPGYKDFKFKNTTDGPLLLQGFTDGDYGYLNIYGPKPDKKVELIGPIYSGRIPEKYKDLIEFVDWNEIAWVQQVTHDNGKVDENLILAVYKTAPRKYYGLEY